MIYVIPGKPWLTYRLGDTVHTIDGISGKIVGLTKPEKTGPTLARIVDAAGNEHLINRQHIRKIESEG